MSRVGRWAEDEHGVRGAPHITHAVSRRRRQFLDCSEPTGCESQDTVYDILSHMEGTLIQTQVVKCSLFQPSEKEKPENEL